MTLKHDTSFEPSEFEKRMDRYYLNRFNIYKKDYDRAFNYANKNWYNMLPKAQGKNAVSIADQIAQACKIPYSVGAEIAQSISLSRGL